MKPFALIVDGKSVETVRHREVRNPATGDVVGAHATCDGRRPGHGRSRCNRRVRKLEECPGGRARRSLSAPLRRTIEENCRRAGAAAHPRAGQAAQWPGIAVRDRRRRRLDASHRRMSLAARKLLQDRPEGRVELHRKPIGVVGSITPWNWPVMIACWHIIPAIRAGNTVVIKPSPHHAAVARSGWSRLMNEKLPPGVVNVVTGENEIGAADVRASRHRQGYLHRLHRDRREDHGRAPPRR